MSSSRPSAPPAERRRVAARPCRCCPASRCELTGDQLRLTGTDLELTISVEVAVSGEADGVVVLPGRLASDIVRALPAGSVSVEVADDEARISAARSEFSLRVLPADEFPRLTEAGRRAGHPRQRRAGRRAHAGGAGRVERRRPADPHRRAPGRRGRRSAPGRHRLLPARHPRPARHHGAERGPARAGAVPGAPGARPAAQPATTSCPCASASARPASRSAAPASPPCSSRASSRPTSG